MNQRLLLIGGGDQALALIAELELNKFEKVGIIEADASRVGHKFYRGISVIGTDADVPNLIKREGYNSFIITVGAVKWQSLRAKLFQEFSALGLKPFTFVSPRATIVGDVEVGEGTMVLKGAIVGPRVIIGKNCIINTGAIIEHGVQIGDNVHIAPGAVLLGGVHIGNEVLVGANATVKQYVKIYSQSIVAAGAYIEKDVPKPGIWTGPPLRKLEI